MLAGRMFRNRDTSTGFTLPSITARRTSSRRLTASRLDPPDANPSVIHVRAKRITELQLPQQVVTLSGPGYRMRVTPTDQSADPNRQPPNREPPISEIPTLPVLEPNVLPQNRPKSPQGSA
jgi:hypothetical protein